jgi:predicted metal-dependent hydrolase
MVKSGVIFITGIGKVLFERSRRSRRINITIKPFGGIRVAVPVGVSFKEARDFVYAKSGWIRQHIKKMRRYERELVPLPRKSREIDRAVAKRVLSSRLQNLAQKYGFTYNTVTIRDQHTRWGSCSGKDNISLNMKLLRLPDELINYVLLHELVHTRVRNHGKLFWAEMEKYVVGARSLASRLRKYELYLQ